MRVPVVQRLRIAYYRRVDRLYGRVFLIYVKEACWQALEILPSKRRRRWWALR